MREPSSVQCADVPTTVPSIGMPVAIVPGLGLAAAIDATETSGMTSNPAILPIFLKLPRRVTHSHHAQHRSARARADRTISDGGSPRWHRIHRAVQLRLRSPAR